MKAYWTKKGSFFLLSLLVLPGSASASAYLSEDFDTHDGGFSVANAGAVEGPWRWDFLRGTWRTDGTENLGSPTASLLSSPAFTVTQNGLVLMEFDHRYSFEYDGTTRWDGGQVRLSVNGGPYNPVPPANFLSNGYTGVIEGNNALNGQAGYNGDSPGYGQEVFITSELSLGTFSAGDELSVQFIAAWDEFAKGLVPNWEVTRVEVVPEPATLGLLALGALALIRRRN